MVAQHSKREKKKIQKTLTLKNKMAPKENKRLQSEHLKETGSNMACVRACVRACARA